MATSAPLSERLIAFLHRVMRALANRGRRVAWIAARIIYQLTPLPRPLKRRIARKLMPPPPEVAAPIEIDFSAATPFGYPLAPGSPKLAVVCHIFYDALAPEIGRYLRNIPIPFDLFISTDTDAKKAAIEGTFAEFTPGRVEVRLAPNRGRDIAPKLVTFGDIYPHYDYALHLHSKASKHADELELWRGFLFENLLGSPDIVRSVLDAFARRPDLGLIASQHFEPVRHWVNWGGNFKATARLAERLGIALEAERLLDFPSGSMFWVRCAALKPLLELQLQFTDFDIESGQVDKTFAHAIERLYFHVAERAGFRWMKIAHPPLFAVTPAIVPIGSPGDLDRFLAEHGRALLGDNLPAPRKAHMKGVPPAPGLSAKLKAAQASAAVKVPT